MANALFTAVFVAFIKPILPCKAWADEILRDPIYSGQNHPSVAIKNGLRLVQGEFMTWPDADDFYSSPDAIAKMVKALQTATPDVAMARVRETVVGEDAATVYWVFGKDAGGLM